MNNRFIDDRGIIQEIIGLSDLVPGYAECAGHDGSKTLRPVNYIRAVGLDIPTPEEYEAAKVELVSP